HRAMVGEVKGRARFVAGQIFDDLRDYVARALNDDTVTRPHAEAADLVAVVKGDIRHDDSAAGDRREPAHGGQLAGAADLDVDGLERRLRTLSRKFVRDGPSRRLGNETEPGLPVEPVNLVDDAVDIIGHVG